MQKTALLVVGYRTRAIDGIEQIGADVAPSDAAWQELAEDKAPVGLVAAAPNVPFLATIDEMVLVDPFFPKTDGTKGQHRMWRHDPTGEKPSVAIRCREYIRGAYPEAWHPDPDRTRLQFVAFDADLFVRLLAFDCARPGADKPMPFATWTADRDLHVSLMKLMVPPEIPADKSAEFLKRWQPAGENKTKAWADLLEAWPEYNRNPRRDALVAVELAGMVGII